MKNHFEIKLVFITFFLFFLLGCGSNHIRPLKDVRLDDNNLYYYGEDLYSGQLLASNGIFGIFNTSISTEKPIPIVITVDNGKITYVKWYKGTKTDEDKKYITDDKGDLYFYYDNIEGEFDGDKMTQVSDKNGKVIIEGYFEGHDFIKDGDFIHYPKDGKQTVKKVFENNKEIKEE
jgi:hypothetical protein